MPEARRLSTIPEEPEDPLEEPAADAKSLAGLAALVRENAGFRNKIADLLIATPRGSDQQHMPEIPRTTMRYQPPLFVPWEHLLETEVLASDSTGVPKVCQQEPLLSGSRDFCPKLRREFSAVEELPDIKTMLGQGPIEEDTSTQVTSCDSDSPEISERVPKSNGGDSDSSEVSADEGSSKGSQTEAMGAETSPVKRSLLRERATRSMVKESAIHAAKTGSSTLLAAGLAPDLLLAGLVPDDEDTAIDQKMAKGRRLHQALRLQEQVALLASPVPDDNDLAFKSKMTKGGRRSPGGSGDERLLQLGSYVQVRGLPPHACLGTVLVVNHAEGKYKVRMSDGTVQWREAATVDPLPRRNS